MADILSGAVTDWITNAIQNAIEWIIAAIFSAFNYFVDLIGPALTESPASWKFFNIDVGSELSNFLLSGDIHEAFVAIAGFILAYVACYELITMVIERNNLADIDTWIFIRWIFKTSIAMMIVTHATDIILAIFEAGTWLGSKVGMTSAHITVDITSTQAWTMLGNLLSPDTWLQLLLLALLMLIIYVCMAILGVVALLMAYGHVLSALLLMSIAPIPLATLGNQELGHIGKDYLKALASCALEGVIMLMVMKVYSVIATTAVGTAIVNCLNSATSGVLSIFTALLIAVLSCAGLVGGLKMAKNISNAAFGAH